jgi:hypothetical protein
MPAPAAARWRDGHGVLRQGLATPEHAAFVQRLQERRATS